MSEVKVKKTEIIRDKIIKKYDSLLTETIKSLGAIPKPDRELYLDCYHHAVEGPIRIYGSFKKETVKFIFKDASYIELDLVRIDPTEWDGDEWSSLPSSEDIDITTYVFLRR